MSASLRVVLLVGAAVALAAPAGAQEHAHLPASPSPRSVVPSLAPRGVPAPASVMWIGAHPDDEVPPAPLLARWCRGGEARCSMLIATRGERGPCLLPGGCLPDLATVRSAEALASAEFLGAELFLLSLPDGGGAAPPVWAPGTSGAADAVARLAAFLRAEAPEMVLTFDPRHGTSCHPDHRALADLVLQAAALVDPPPAVYLLETFVEIDAQAPAFRFAPAAPGTIAFDANEPLPAAEGPAWAAVESVMERHASQFDAAWRAAVWRVPEEERAVFLAPAAAILKRPVATCP